jgi:hypothetical protein
MYAELWLLKGDKVSAVAFAEQALAMANAVGSLFSEGLARRVLARATGDDKQFASSAECLDEGNARLEAARTREAWADSLYERGQKDQVLSLYTAALEQFQASGLTNSIRRVTVKMEQVC